MVKPFDSTNDKRVDNNPTLPEEYTGPDDVSLRYRPLSDKEKSDMGRIKLLSQQLINEIRNLDPDNLISESIEGKVVRQEAKNKFLEMAVDNVRLAAMLAVKQITGPK